MTQIAWIIAMVAALPLLAVVAILIWRRADITFKGMARTQAKQDFRLQREQLEAKFVSLASQSGRPRGLEWDVCDFDNDVSFAKDKASGELRALVGVSISFTAVEGGGMEDNPNVGNLRAATAVFIHRGGRWETDGRAIMNLAPHQAISHFQNQMEAVE